MAAPTQAYTGSETVSTTEWSLTTDTAGPDVTTVAGWYTPVIDLVNLADGDVFELRLYEKISGSGSTQRLVYDVSFAGAQTKPIWIGEAYPLMHGWDFTLKKVAGTDRAIEWSIRKA